MGREIEFRAYYKPLKKYLPISSISFNIGVVKGSDPLEIVSLGGVSSFTLYGVERPNVATPVPPESVVIEQFTGLLDRNGKKIYVGDILETCCGKAEVYFDDELLTCKIIVRHGGTMPLVGKKSARHFDYEVIGNIRENPELLNDWKE